MELFEVQSIAQTHKTVNVVVIEEAKSINKILEKEYDDKIAKTPKIHNLLDKKYLNNA